MAIEIQSFCRQGKVSQAACKNIQEKINSVAHEKVENMVSKTIKAQENNFKPKEKQFKNGNEKVYGRVLQ